MKKLNFRDRIITLHAICVKDLYLIGCQLWSFVFVLGFLLKEVKIEAHKIDH
jgi:hypothetical protein